MRFAMSTYTDPDRTDGGRKVCRFLLLTQLLLPMNLTFPFPQIRGTALIIALLLLFLLLHRPLNYMEANGFCVLLQAWFLVISGCSRCRLYGFSFTVVSPVLYVELRKLDQYFMRKKQERDMYKVICSSLYSVLCFNT